MIDSAKPIIVDSPEMLEALQHHATLVEEENEQGEKVAYYQLDFDPREAIYLTERSAWQCPACGCGVRGDVEVCPNCVKNANREELISTDEVDRIRAGGNNIERIITEYIHPKGFAPIDKPATRSGGHG